MKELVTFKKLINGESEHWNVVEIDESTRYIVVPLTEDRINELKDGVGFGDTWEEVQDKVRNNDYGAETYEAFLNAGYDPEDGQNSLIYEFHL